MPNFKFAIVTPTYQRSAFLDQAYHYATGQILTPNIQLKWFVLDDSAVPHASDWVQQDPSVNYQWVDQRIPLGKKRNILNDEALAWGLIISLRWMMMIGIARIT